MPPSDNLASFHAQLSACLGQGQIITDSGQCVAYGFDNSRQHALPQAVVFPTSQEQVRDVIRLCKMHRTPVIARGRGTGTTGATVPISGGVVLSTEHMDKIVEVDPANRFMVVQPGVTNQAVQDAAGKHGFFWPPDPTSAAYCSVGGNLAYNSAGPRALKYGTPRDNTLGLRAVTGDGREIRTGVYTSKGVVGYDLTRLIIGSEGTLAIITEATLKLVPLAAGKRTLRALYSDIRHAAQAVTRVMAQPTVPCALEFMDHQALVMIRNYADVEVPANARALLIAEVDGAAETLDTAARDVSDALNGEGIVELTSAKDPVSVAELWKMRKALSPALRNVAPQKINEDVVIPVSYLAEFVIKLQELAQLYNIHIVNFGHAGNGNIHVNILYDPAVGDAQRRAETCLAEVFRLVIRLRGTLSGEHGIGLIKRDFVPLEIDPNTLALMHQIKRQFDPQGILNPQKTLPNLPTAKGTA